MRARRAASAAPGSGRAGERASATVELVILAPVLVVFAVVVVMMGRLELARQQVVAAARAGAQAAAVQPSAAQARWAASAAATVDVFNHAQTCRREVVSTDTSSFRPGGSVRVQVACIVPLADLGVPGAPGTETITAAITAPIDPYRVVR